MSQLTAYSVNAYIDDEKKLVIKVQENPLITKVQNGRDYTEKYLELAAQGNVKEQLKVICWMPGAAAYLILKELRPTQIY